MESAGALLDEEDCCSQVNQTKNSQGKGVLTVVDATCKEIIYQRDSTADTYEISKKDVGRDRKI